MLIRASYWTWKIISGEQIPEPMPTAYLMLDGNCMYNCSYCTHARDSLSDNKFLSRITWKEIDLDSLLSMAHNFRRICFQVVNYNGALKDAKYVVEKVRENDKDIAISVSTRVLDKEDIDAIFESGASNLGIAIDVANSKLHRQYRGWDMDYTLELIEYGAQKYPNRITTHLIVGLGENDREIFEIFKKMKESNVEIALFAFTPIKGTKLEHAQMPPLERYRKIQILRYIMFEKALLPWVEFDEKGNISRLLYEESLETLDITKAFLTSGCKDCTRPFYNDRPGNNKEFYNVHSFISEYSTNKNE
ncbi:MAG TPA: radical SAM protein [Fervidobacterium sp.]|nr:radical SAM protein [Fervidobacterium sp.]HOM74079.1 radical SAM protein [Fervidobacterium sp.]HOQ39790.1 radical SAM protein [Fervidobacterium sp.]HPP17732.1 radical SAM protein [Fervidobacterium sp.]HPT54354.1 radical SAM protein [Fervidobacterium sp.]